MKRTSTILLTLFAIAASGMAQVKYLDIYQNGKITHTLATTDVDSISISGSEFARMVNFYRGVNLVNSYLVTAVDSIKVFRSNEEPLVYMGIVGFNQELYTKPIDVLASSTSSPFKSFVSSLSRKDGTLLYYAVDNALDMLASYSFPTALGSINLVTFTDGLDQGSLMMNPTYSTESQYLNAISGRLSNMRVRNLPITAYSLGLRGSDVTDYAMFQNNLRQLASSADKATEVSGMGEVQSRLQEIADRIISISTKQSITARIPGTSNGAQVCFTFDGKDPSVSALNIVGTFNLSDYSLRNVSYHGITPGASTIQGTRDGIFLTFTFTGLQREDGNGLIPTGNIKQYNKASTSSTWQVNSEFSSANNTQTTTTHTGAAILLVLDCSNSLGSQFSNMQSYVQDFITRITNNTASYSISAPENVTAELNSETFQVKVSWNAVKHAESYDVYRSSSSSGSYSKIATSITSTSWTDESPLQGTNYYKVYAAGHGLTSSASAASNVVRFAIDAPTNVKAVLNSSFKIDVSWEAAQYAESYNVYRSSSSGGNYTLVAMGIVSTRWTDDAPLQGNNYYKVVAVGHGLTSSYSSPSNVANYAIAAPANVRAQFDEDAFVINVSWEASPFAESYNVYRSSSSSGSGSYTVVAMGIVSTEWTDESPLQGSNYYKVVAVGHGLTSSYSSPSNVANYAIAAPMNVRATLDEAQLVIELTWLPVKNAERYKVYRSGSSSGTFTEVATDLTEPTWTDVSPLQGSNYYKVYALGRGMTSAASTTTNMVKVNYIPDAPQNVTAVLNEDDFVIDVSWAAVSHAESYAVYRSNSSTGIFTKVAENVTATSWTDETPLTGSNYYQVYAVNRGYTSSASNTTNVVTYALAAPENAKAVLDDDEFVVRVTWNAVNHAESYDVYRSGSNTGEFTKVAENVTATSWTDRSPLAGWNYYKVKAVGRGLESPMSSVVRAVRPLIEQVYTVNGISFTMIKVDGGTFQMGQSADGNNATPIYGVTLSDYYIGETEVTQELWQAVMGSTPSNFSGVKRPVEQVSWYDCQTFITKLNELSGLNFRLPTEAEWEFAAKGGTQSKGYTYSGSNTIDNVAWYNSNSGSQTHDVGTKAPNELGIYDMSGNVWEWCQDWYGSYSSSSQTNPIGPFSGKFRVFRGGSCDSNAELCRSAYRNCNGPTYRSYALGLRIAL